MAATYEDLASDIDRVARNVSSDYPDIDWEDVRQELVVFVLENGQSIKMYDEGGNPRRLLILVANSYAKKLRTQHMSLTPQYAYRPSDVKLILETAFFGYAPSNYVPDDARHPLSKTFNTYDGGKSFQHGTGFERERELENGDRLDKEDLETVVVQPDHFHEMDSIEVASDVKAALIKLKPELKESIFNRYVLGIVPKNSSYERKRLNKAINELTRKLNWYRGGRNPDTRRVLSNAGAQAALSEAYEGR